MEPEETKKKPKKAGKSDGKVVYKFNDAWLDMNEFYSWLEKSSKKKENNCELAYCRICDCTVLAHKSSLLKHRNAEKHKKAEKKMGFTPRPYVPKNREVKVNVNKRAASMKRAPETSELYEYIQDQNSEDLSAHDSDNDTAVAPKHTKPANVIKKMVGNNLDVLYANLKVPGTFFSLYMAETTDPSGMKQYTLTVVFMDEEDEVRYSFFDMFKSTPGLPRNLYVAFKHSIESKEIPLENLVGFSSDTTIVDAFVSHLLAECPNIAYIKSSCHTIQLAASKACLKIPTHVEDLLKNIGQHFNHIYGKHVSYKEFQEFFHSEIHKICSPTTTGWLSVKECVDRILKHYDPLQPYIRQFCIDDPFDTYQTILDTMKNPFTKAYLEFMSYILGILGEFNKMFREERPLLHKMKPQVEKLLKEICLNFLSTDYVMQTPAFEIKYYTDSIFYLPLDKIYLGVSASEIIDDLKEMPTIDEKEISSFFESILEFYVELVTVLKIEFDFHDELYNIISIVDPQTAQDFNMNSLLRVWKRFPVLKKFVDVQALDNEWKKHALLDRQLEGLDPGLPADDYWRRVFAVKSVLGEQVFPNLYTTVKFLLVLPFFPMQLRIIEVIRQE